MLIVGSPECSSQGEDARSHWVGWGLHISKMLNSTEDAHVESMSTFEVDEHLQKRGLLPLLPRLDRMAANGDRTDTVPLTLISLPCY
jgi:hypothetical protein